MQRFSSYLLKILVRDNYKSQGLCGLWAMPRGNYVGFRLNRRRWNPFRCLNACLSSTNRPTNCQTQSHTRLIGLISISLSHTYIVSNPQASNVCTFRPHLLVLFLFWVWLFWANNSSERWKRKEIQGGQLTQLSSVCFYSNICKITSGFCNFTAKSPCGFFNVGILVSSASALCWSQWLILKALRYPLTSIV